MLKFKRLVAVFGLVFLGYTNLFGQANIGLKAVATHSGGGASASGYGPELYNNGAIPAYPATGTYLWGWVTSNGWIEYTWPTAQKINKVVFHKDNRPMTACTFEYWNGTSYVSFYTYNSSVTIKDSVSFATITTTKLRFNNVSGSSNPNHREIQVYGPTAANDASISLIKPPLCSPVVTVTYQNTGTNAIDSVKINWSVDNKLQAQNKYTKSLGAGSGGVDINLTPDFAFVDGTTYKLKVWTSLPNNKQDTFNSNDTALLTFKYLGPAGDPVVKDIIKCGPGRVNLKATPINATDSILWYDASSGGNLITSGRNALTPPLVLGTNTFYAQGVKLINPFSLANSMTPSTSFNYAYSGGFANITTLNDVILDSFTVVLTANAINSTFNVYMKNATHVGFETNASAWTKMVTNGVAKVRLVGSYYRAYIKLPSIYLTKGKVYGFYITTTPVTPSIPYTLAAIKGGQTVQNADLQVYQESINYGAAEFGTLSVGYPLTLETHYSKPTCFSNRVPVLVTVKPSPNGAAFIKGSPFQTTQPNTSGFSVSPDIVANGDVLTYEITPPTGYTNSGYASKWVMKGLTFRTSGGRVLGSSYYSPSVAAPSGSNNAKITFTPDANIIDSTIIMTISLEDLGPYYCDSSLTRYIFIAPRPNTDFKFIQPVCDGDNVIFDNLSTISSGNFINHWDFGTGNPADTSSNTNVVFTFPTHGTFNVKLTSISVPYGYKTTKIIPVDVTEIPKIGFKVFNACMGDSVSFVNSTTISKGNISYKWDLGNGKTSTKVSPKAKYANAGSYQITLTATSNGCSQTMTKNAWQFARPIARFTTPSVLCDKTEIPFSNGSTIATGNMGYRWTFSDGGTSTLTNPTHVFVTPGAKTAKMKVISEFGCADSITKNINLAESPLAEFIHGPVCNLTNTNFQFTGTKPALPIFTTFKWDFEGEGSTTVESPSKLLSIIGKKNVTLTLSSNNGCVDAITKVLDVKLQSKADFNVTDVCDGENVVFINKSTVSSGNLNYLWKFGDGNNSIVQSPRHLYAPGVSQTYNVTMVAIVPGGCSDSVTKQVSVNYTPKSDFTFKTSGRLVYFTPNETGNSVYHWDFGDGAKADGFNTQYHYLNSFEYAKFSACLYVENAAGCNSQTCKEIQITGDVKDISKNVNFKILPNPNNGHFTVEVSEPKSDLNIEVFDLIGHSLGSFKGNGFKTTYPLELNVANGVYLVRVSNGGMVSSNKITVNR
jgi:PKD repeat protein